MYRLITGFVVITYTVLFAREWVEVRSSRPAEPVFNLETHSAGNIEISFELSGYFLICEEKIYDQGDIKNIHAAIHIHVSCQGLSGS